MSDYSLQVTWSTKDALATGQQLKAISATEIGNEFSAIAVAVATKYDSDDLASQAEARALTDPAKLITPDTLDDVLTNNDSILKDLYSITGTAADGVLAWDQTDTTVKMFTMGAGLAFSGTTLVADLDGLGTETTAATGDFIAMVDITDSGSQKITLGNLITSINSIGTIDHDAATNFVADEHVAHSSISITAGVGLSGGGTIDGNVSLACDLSEFTAFSTTAAVDLDADYIIGLDAGTAERKILAGRLVQPEVETVTGTTDTLTNAEHGKTLIYSNAGAITVTLANSLYTGFWATLILTGSTSLALSAAGTLNTAGSLTTCTQQYGAVTVFHAGSNVWYAWGALDS